MEMLHNSTVTRIGGVALILAPLLTAIGLAAHPTDLKDATGQTRVLVADAARWNIVITSTRHSSLQAMLNSALPEMTVPVKARVYRTTHVGTSAGRAGFAPPGLSTRP